jgi:phosphopantothenate synthetase
MKTVGDKLPQLIVQREKLRGDLKDMAAEYRQQIKELDEQIKETAFNADQVLMAFEDGDKTA